MRKLTTSGRMYVESRHDRINVGVSWLTRRQGKKDDEGVRDLDACGYSNDSQPMEKPAIDL